VTGGGGGEGRGKRKNDASKLEKDLD